VSPSDDEPDDVIAPDLDVARPRVPAPDSPPAAGDFPLVIEIEPTMVGQRPRRQLPADDRLGIDGPGPERAIRSGLDQEIPVDAVPMVFQDGESPRVAHGGFS
jgi:hypothetical protein